MTTPSLSWIDRSRWSLLLENATPAAVVSLRPPRKATPRPTAAAKARLASAAGARAPQGDAAPPEAPALAEDSAPTLRPPTFPPPPASAFRPPSASPPALPPAFEPPHGELEERLQAFFEWVLRSVPCSAAFIADEHGLPLIQRGAMLDYIAFSSSVLTLLSSIASLEGHEKRWLSIGVARDTILHLAEVSTVWGRFGVGIVASESLRAELLGIVQQGLEGAFKE